MSAHLNKNSPKKEEETNEYLQKFYVSLNNPHPLANHIVPHEVEECFYKDFIKGKIMLMKKDGNIFQTFVNNSKSMISTENKFKEQFVYIDCIGYGSFSEVCRYIDVRKRKIVAVKNASYLYNEKPYENNIFKKTNDDFSLFPKSYNEGISWPTYRECSILSELNSRYCVSSQRFPFGKKEIKIVMEYYPCNLCKLINLCFRKYGRMPLNLIKKIMRDLLRSVRYLHYAKAILHRDVKNNNILINIPEINNELNRICEEYLRQKHNCNKDEDHNFEKISKSFNEKIDTTVNEGISAFIERWMKSEKYTFSSEYKEKIDKNTHHIQSIPSYEEKIKEKLSIDKEIIRGPYSFGIDSISNPTVARYKYYTKIICNFKKDTKNNVQTEAHSASSCPSSLSSNNIYEIMDYYSQESDSLVLNKEMILCGYYPYAVALLSDYGSSKRWQSIGEGNLTPPMMVQPYSPPECLKNRIFPINTPVNYDNSVDIWALGIIFCEMITGRCPFEQENPVEQLATMFSYLFNSSENDSLQVIEEYKIYLFGKKLIYNLGIKRLIFSILPNGFDKDYFEMLLGDENLLELLKGMLQINPSKRLTADECLQSNFFKY